MEDFNNIYEKAGVLMQGALKKYAEGDFAGGDKERQQANELYDLAEKYANMKSANDSMLYGENRNFGIIYNIVEANTRDWYLKTKNRKALVEVKKLFDSNETLKKEFEIYNAFNTIREGIDIEKYVKDVLNLTPKMTVKELKENNQKLIDLIRKYDGNELIEISDKDMELYEAIEYVITKNKTAKNLQDFILSEQKIVEHLKDNTLKTETSIIDEGSIEESIEKIKEIYNKTLNENERDLLDNVAKNGNNIEEVFNSVKKEITETVNKALSESDDMTKDRWKQVLEHINEMKYEENNGVDNLVKLFEIKDTFI